MMGGARSAGVTWPEEGRDVATTPIVNFRFQPELLARIDAARGDEPRTTWLIRAIEHELDKDPGSDAKAEGPPQ